MSLDYLIVYKSDNPKVRVGSGNDGGYIIADNLEYDCCISCGIANDINFEKEFSIKYPNLDIIAFDGTINQLPEYHPKIQFVKKNIGTSNSDTTTNLFDFFEKYDNIFVKMDIERYEYQWLHSLSQEQLKKIKQLVIEFHYPFTDNHGFRNLSGPKSIPEKTGIIKNLVETHTLVHLHGNNCCGITMYEGCVVPNVFECTYIRKDIQPQLHYTDDKIPSPLDYPNVIGPDIELNHYPFVNTPSNSNNQ
jgi:hypothetical protein